MILAMAKPQTHENHTALDTITHFILGPLFLINFFYAVYMAFHAAPGTLGLHLWWVVISIGLILLNVKTRFYALKGQDRLIRLEERLRLAALVPEKDKAIVAKLTEDQLIGLRFADDEELAALAVRAVEENLTRKQIKAAIEKWRPDHFRV
jgi:hypothetical protein